MNKTTFALYFLIATLSTQFADLQARNITISNSEIRIEPTYWWTNMYNPNLQILLYGKEIAKNEISITYPGISLVERKLTDNPNYVFLYLNIGKETKTGFFNIELKNGKKKRTIRYELKERIPNSANRESFSEKDNVYLIMPDRFVNGDTRNDSVKGYKQGVNRSGLGFRQGGDIEGIIQKIPYLADLGITALWTTPMLENRAEEYSYHHYSVSDYYKVDPRLGTNDDYVRLSQTAQKYGIKLIIDIVPNHCGSGHWWMRDMPDKNWFNTWNSFTSSNYRITAWTDPHRSESDLNRLTKGWFSGTQPDFNLSNPLVFDYLTQAYIYWIERAQISGIRMDTYPYNDIHVASHFVQTIRNEYPKMNVVGECWVKTPAETAYYQSGNNNKDGFDSRLQSVMDFVLKDKLQEVFNEKDGWDSGTAKFYSHFAQDFVYPNPNCIMNFVDNHDIDRLSTAYNDIRKYKMALAMLVTVRGYPQIYYGNEIMQEGIAGSYEGHRFTFPGGWKDDTRNAFTRDGRTGRENDVFDYLRSLLNYRKNNAVLQNGKMTQFIPENGVYVFFRNNNEKTVMVICNNNEHDTVLNTNRFEEQMKGFNSGLEITSDRYVDVTENITIEGKTVLVVELRNRQSN
ncbi:MAG: alpha-amylase family glycosyl hydrolase [Paludibacteraceae bacterium]